MNLTEQLQRASNLALIQDLINVQRKKIELQPKHKEFLKTLLWPWWVWVLNMESEEVPFRQGWRGLILELIQKDGVDSHREHLDILCKHVWLNTELPEAQQAYLLKIALDLRKYLLMEGSSY